MTDQDFHWLVGLLEGEGTFMKGPPCNPNSPVIAAVSTDEDVIARISKLWGMSYHDASTDKFRINGWKTPYRTSLRGRKAVDFMRQIRPYMSLRRQAQIDAALLAYDPDLKWKSSGKLSLPQVFAIRQSVGSLRQVGEQFGVSVATVSRIRSGRQWSRA